jgi:transposase InsO family protein
MCKILKVSQSGYYAWGKRQPSRRQRENELLLGRIKEIWKQSRCTYGSPRITIELNEEGMRCGKNRIARIMKVNGIQAKMKRKYKVTTDSWHKYPIAQNLLKEDGSSLQKAWVSDITYIRTAEGWLYLAAVMKVRSRKIIGWSLKARLTKDLVIEALNKAMKQERAYTGVIHHSDRGSQYASHEYQDFLKEHGIMPSMCGRGNCYDNAYIESFFHTLKTELISFERYDTREEARLSVFEYIEVFYNRERRHSALGYRSPVEYERLNNAA